jgi:Sec-independent protein translocase protein TatA
VVYLILVLSTKIQRAGTDLANAYGSYQSNMANRDNTKAQMNYIQNLQRQQDLENEYQRTARAQTQAGANAGFNNSVLGSSSNYYSA